MEHSPTSATGTGWEQTAWHATQRAAWEALKKKPACPHAQADKFFPRSVERARKTLAEGGKDCSRLEGFTWHGNRHTFASRLAMTGADLLTIRQVGGWKTLGMVQRYAHLTPNRLHEAVERLVSNGATELARN